MKTLLLLRHGKSSWDNAGLSDHERPLKKRGRRDAPRMGKLLKDEKLVPDLILSSTADRASHTADLVAESCGYAGEIERSAALYHGSLDDFRELLNNLDDGCDCVMVVGHNPGLEELLKALTGKSERLTTAALAQVSLPIASWRGLTLTENGSLENVWRPKELEYPT